MNEQPWRLIDWFDDFDGPNTYSFLSNFHEGNPIIWKGYEFPTTEHAFAWEKVDPYRDKPHVHHFIRTADDIGWKNSIRTAKDPGEAKALGRMCPLRPDWEEVKFGVMQDIVWEKFTQHDDLGFMLMATGDAYLQEGTFWGDEVWGVNAYASDDPFKRPGRNWLGIILMGTRARLLAERVTVRS